jgi:hypothetical protein
MGRGIGWDVEVENGVWEVRMGRVGHEGKEERGVYRNTMYP